MNMEDYLDPLTDLGVTEIADLNLWTQAELEGKGIKLGHAKKLLAAAASYK